MSSGYKSKKPMFRHSTNISYIDGSIGSIKTKSTTGRVERDGAESIQSVHNVDPRFMIIEKDEPPPSPKIEMPSEVKVESWLNRNEKTQIDFTKSAVTVPTTDRLKLNLASKSTIVQQTRKPYFLNLKQLHNAQSVTRTIKPRSISASRATISNHEVSSTNDDTPRRRKLTLRDKLNKLHTPVPTSNCQTIDVHHGEYSTNDSHDCCFKRNCESKVKLDHKVNVVNLCCSNQKVIIIKPKIIPDPILTEEEEEEEVEGLEKPPKKLTDKIGDRLDRSRFFEEQIHLIRMKEEIENFYMASRPSDIKPICKLMFPIIIFILLSLAMFSFYYDIGVFTRFFNIIESWIGYSALLAKQRARPPTKWELWSKFMKKCVEKLKNSVGTFRR